MFIPVKILSHDQTGYELQAAGIDSRDDNATFVDGWLCAHHITYLNQHGYKDDRIEVGLLSGNEITIQGTLEDLMKKIDSQGMGSGMSAFTKFLKN